MVDEKKLWTEFNALIKAVEKCGVLEMAADMSANNAKIEAAIKSALTRYAVKPAVINSVWQSVAVTALFDVQLLFDGSFMQYLIKIDVSGLYGGAVGRLSSWVSHPFFSNGIVLGVIVGSAFGVVSLVSTGDWEAPLGVFSGASPGASLRWRFLALAV